MAAASEHGVLPTDHESPTSVTTVEAAAHQGAQALQDIAFGSIAGAVGKVIEYPFDTVKVRLQSQPDGLPLRYTGPLDCFRQSLAKDGFIGIYRGVSAPIFGAAVETSSLFLSVGPTWKLLHLMLDTDGSDCSTGLLKRHFAQPSFPLLSL